MAKKRRTTTRRRKTFLDDIGDVGAVAEVIRIPGKGIRCKDSRGKFTSCLSDSMGDLGQLGDLVQSGDLGSTKRKRKTTKEGSEYIPGVGVRCRLKSGKNKGRFTKCR